MSVALTLDIKLWKPGQSERRLTGRQLHEQYQQLKDDEQLLQAMMIDNFGFNLVVDGQTISRGTCMFDGQSSPDLLQLYEDHLTDLWQRKPVIIHFYEDMIAWRMTPEGEQLMKWEILNNSRGISQATVEQAGQCARLPFISAAVAWLREAIMILELYQSETVKAGGEDLATQIDVAQRLYDYSHRTLKELGWQAD